jgi:hypothetical protein
VTAAAPKSGMTISSGRPAWKKYLPLIIAGSVALVLVIGGGVAYALYQKPENAFKDALGNVMTDKTATFKGSLVGEEDGNKFNLTFTGQGDEKMTEMNGSVAATLSGTDIALDGSLVSDANGDTYVKVSKLKAAVDTVYKDVPGVAGFFAPLVDKVDNKWIKATEKDLKDMGLQKSDKSSTCFEQFSKTITDNKGEREAYIKLYQQHSFVTVDKQLGDEVVNGMGSFHYKVAYKPSVAREFVKGLASIESYKQLQTCSEDSYKIDESALTDDAKFEVDAWVEKWSHRFTRVVVASSDNKTRFTVEPEFNKPVKVNIPSGTTTIKDLQADFEKAFGDLLTPTAPVGTSPTLEQ